MGSTTAKKAAKVNVGNSTAGDLRRPSGRLYRCRREISATPVLPGTSFPRVTEIDEGGQARHRDHDAEQAYLTGARVALDAMIERSERALEFGNRQVTEEKTVESRIVRTHLADRRAAVDVGRVTLCFGRIDEDPEIADGDQWYVGRRHIEGSNGEPLVVDWRAPVAIPFYRATAADPFGLLLRRRYSCQADELVAIFDEALDDPSSMSATGIPDPLLAEIERGRSGQMADIVATIAAEQDEIIRAGLEECLLVQGGPGTGKTAVGLHRAAFLLFEHRELLARTQVLVIGPNRVFLRYVANVLPSLGETAVTQATITSLLSARVRVRAEESPEVDQLKGRAVMAQVIDRLARHRLRPPIDDIILPVGLRKARLEPATVQMALNSAQDTRLPLNEAKAVFTEILLREVSTQLQTRGVDPQELANAVPAVRSSPEFRKAIDRCWPSLSGPQIVRALLGSPKSRHTAAESLLSPAELDLLHRRSAKKIADEPWTAADLALLDEANALTVGVRRRYGHVVIDEAQDLSAMALRAAGRRATNGSMTILGDIAQATGVSAQPSWDDVATGLGVDPQQMRTCELTVGYRVPGPILDFANRLLPVTAPSITPSTSIRDRGLGVDRRLVTAADLPAEVVSRAVDLSENWTSVGIIVPDRIRVDVLEALALGGLDAVDTRRGTHLDQRVSVVDPPTAKGLEFDATIVVEPSAIASEPSGLRLLYVALTRSVQELVIVHTEPLPTPLD